MKRWNTIPWDPLHGWQVGQAEFTDGRDRMMPGPRLHGNVTVNLSDGCTGARLTTVRYVRSEGGGTWWQELVNVELDREQVEELQKALERALNAHDNIAHTEAVERERAAYQRKQDVLLAKPITSAWSGQHYTAGTRGSIIGMEAEDVYVLEVQIPRTVDVETIAMAREDLIFPPGHWATRGPL